MYPNLSTVAEQRDIQRHVLSNGLVVVTETMRHVRSVSVGIWNRNGSRREAIEQNGLARLKCKRVLPNALYTGTRTTVS
jgi:predicted Zn-dependent peptidase